MTRIDAREKERLLKIARSAIEAHIAGRADPDAAASSDLPHGGVFITLRKHGLLRGCIGTFDATDDLFATIRRMAVAAVHDPRFIDQPMRSSELAEIRIEISLLSPLELVQDPLNIEVGRHGVYIRRGVQSGCFLPEVAAEHGWDAATLLSVCCHEKAGLDSLAWQQPGTDVYVFSAEKCREA